MSSEADGKSTTTELDSVPWVPRAPRTRLWLFATGLVVCCLLAAGLVQTVAVARSLLTASNFWLAWEPAQCRVLECEAQHGFLTDPTKKTFMVRFALEAGGKKHINSTLLELPPGHASLRLTGRPYSVNDSATCWVLSGHPEFSSLESPPELDLQEALLAGVLLGLGLLGLPWWSGARRAAREASRPPREMAAGVLLFDERACLPRLHSEPGEFLAHRVPPQPPFHEEWSSWVVIGTAAGLIGGLAGYLTWYAAVWSAARAIALVFAALGLPACLASLMKAARAFGIWRQSSKALLEVSAWPVRPGKSVQFRCVQEGTLHCAKIRLMLIREEMIGRDTHEEKSDLALEKQLAIAEQVALAPGRPWSCSGEFTLPADSPQSLAGDTCRIDWRLELRFKLAGEDWLTREFPLLVAPEEVTH